MTDITLHSTLSRKGKALAFERLITRFGRKLMPDELSGSIRIELPSGMIATVNGESPGHDAELKVNSWQVLRRSMQAGANGFAESYIRGEVDSSDLVTLMRFFAANRQPFLASGGRLFSSRGLHRLRHLRRANTRSGSRRNIAAHYDLSNDFFRICLDDTMTYSSALFPSSETSLQAAQLNKYDRIISALDLPERATVLEVGCGWGGFAARLLKGSDHTYRGISLSREQLRYARARTELEGTIHPPEFAYEDYRDQTGQFDAIASIEMFEAVGEAHWPEYFAMLHDRLKPGGTAVIQSITIAPEIFERYRRRADFIQTYIFPGGMLPTAQAIRKHAGDAGLTAHRVERFGQDYARTLQIWRERFEDHWQEVAALGFDNRFRRMWRFYLAYCEGGFREELIDVEIFKFRRAS
jgi:cyclopropane-fatty-acyl-phospholipid synthase